MKFVATVLGSFLIISMVGLVWYQAGLKDGRNELMSFSEGCMDREGVIELDTVNSRFNCVHFVTDEKIASF